jgi:hypothetical protein
MRPLSSRAALGPALVLSLGLAACEGGQAMAPPANTPAAAPAKAADTPQAAVAAGHLRRTDVDRALTQLGLPWLFRRVLSEESFGKDGSFSGWRITGLPEEWASVDLRPGDVVMRVNNKTVETPEDAWEAWKSVALSREIKVALQRDGVARELSIPIDGDPDPVTLKTLEQGPPAPPQPQGGKAAPPPEKRTVVRIGGEAPSPAGDWESESY